MGMTVERAREIMDAFDSCSTVYECMTVDEVIRNTETMTETEWCQIQVDSEDVLADRRSFDGPEPYEEWRDEIKPPMVERLAAIDIVVS